MGGIGIQPFTYKDLSEHLLPILKDAYTIRTTLAEKDIYGNLEICLVTSRTPFQPSCMDGCYRVHDRLRTTIQTNDSLPWKEDYAIGSVALGLEMKEDDDSSTARVILKPEVIVSSFDTHHDKGTYFLLRS